MRVQSLSSCSIALILTAIGAMAPGCGRGSDAKPKVRVDPAVPVSLSPAVTKAVQRQIEVVGTLWADEDATVSSKVAGKVVAVLKDIGDTVDAAQPLAQIEKTDYELMVSQKALAVSESLSKIGLKELPAGDFDATAVPTVQRAKVRIDNAQAKFDRGKQLFEQTSPRISAQEFDDLKTALDVAARDFDVEVLTAKSVLGEARARQADLEIAKQHLLDTAIRAPRGAHEGGKPRTYAVATRMMSVGEYAKEGDPAFRLVDDALLKLRANVPERYSNQIAKGQKVRVRVEASPDDAWGEVTRVNPQVDPANRTFEVEVWIANAARVLKPGAFARAWVQTHSDPHVVFVPQEAVVSFAGVNKVFTVEAAQAREVPVELGEHDGDLVEITRGLKGDESVVVAGTSKLATGVKVDVQQPEASPKGAATQAAPSEETGS